MSDAGLGAFAIVDEIAEGGTAVVYRGTHRHSGLPVAIKVLTRGEPGSLAMERALLSVQYRCTGLSRDKALARLLELLPNEGSSDRREAVAIAARVASDSKPPDDETADVALSRPERFALERGYAGMVCAP